MTSSMRKVPGKRGFRKLSFDEAFPLAVDEATIGEELTGPLSQIEREVLEECRRGLANRLSPAIRQATSRLNTVLRVEAKRWIFTHGGMPNISAFIAHFQALPEARRIYRWGHERPLTDDAIRKRLKKLGFIPK